MKIIIADDDQGITESLSYFLEQKGHSVDIVGDGYKAVELIRANKYWMAFLDYNMPELTGLEVIRCVRASDLKIIIIMITGYPFIKEFLVKSMGADEYINKPYDSGEIDAILKKYSENIN